MASAPIGVSDIFGRLAKASARLRYAFMVLNLLSDAADARDRAATRMAIAADGRAKGAAITAARDAELEKSKI